MLKGFVYDAAGELERRNDALLGEIRYDYDPVRRVTGARTEPSSAHRLPVDERYAYDPAGNLIATGSQDGPWWEQPLAEGVRYNRLETLDDIRCTYDAHGRLIRRDAGGTSQYFTYNSEHQLLHVRTVRRSNVGVESEQTYFAYDALGRRIAKRNSGNVTRFVWDGMRLLQERRKGLAGTYVYEENAQEETYAPLARLDTPAPVGTAFGKPTLTENTPSAQFYYFHINASGQPEELTDADGKVVWQARYATWGRVLEERSAPGIEQNLRFQGQYFDQETGLCYNTFRYYDPDLGRFITEDPIGLSGGINLYQYGPNPLMWIDPWGWVAQANGGIAPQHGGTGHNATIDKEIQIITSTSGTSNVRKNQEQVDINGNKVGSNRPDIQFDRNGKHYNIEFDTDPKSSRNHQNVLPNRDPNARNTYWLIDKNGNKLRGFSQC